MPPPTGAELALPAEQVGELIKTIVKALRAFQMYPPNNPMYQRNQQAIRDAFLPIWSATPGLTLAVTESDLVWEEQIVYHQPHRAESFAWMLYQDGMRILRLRPGVETEEIVTFLQVVARARLLATDAADDLLTLLWEQEFLFMDYQFAETFGEGGPTLEPRSVLGSGAALPETAAATTCEQVAAEVEEARALPPELEEFDSTLYFLEGHEIRALADQVAQEYSRDVRQAAFDALLDTFELQSSNVVRAEILGIFEQLVPNLLNRGEFRVVAGLLREFKAIAQRVTVMDGEIRQRLLSFQARLSEPSILAQLLQALEASSVVPDDADIGMVLGELYAEGLETMLTFLPGLKRPTIRQILEESVARLGAAHSDVLLGLIRKADSEALPGAVALCGRLKLSAAVPGLEPLLGHPEVTVRRSAVEALGGIGSPGALAVLERALDDPDRGVRSAAVGLVVKRGYRGALRRLEAVVQGRGPQELERAERRHFFEAYAVLGGPAILPVLTDLLEPKGIFRRKGPVEVRTCAAYAVARLQIPEARALLERLQQDKELPVRNAAVRALREWRA
ncbi:MAG: HEAT repeat domain-containing protein [Gemmatimonadales bacterium]